MRRRLNPKKVTWAPDANLCQVKLFLSEDYPSQVGFTAQDHLQAKPSHHASGIASDDNLPPGFEGTHASNIWRNKLAQIPVIKWQHPLRFMLEASWQVVSGEESQEREVQKQREMRVLEAIYPRPSAIPLNPSAGAEHIVLHTDNQHTPLIPITPVEEDDAADTTSSQHDASVGPTTTTMAAGAASSSGGSMDPDDALTVALAALSSVMANDHGNLIDSQLLIKILSDPQIIGQLVTNHGPGSFSSTSNPPPPLHLPPPPPPPGKDINYYKTLIQQHGGEGERQPPSLPPPSLPPPPLPPPPVVGSRFSRDPPNKPKMMKPCMFFNSQRGCRHGVKCAFLHDSPTQPPPPPPPPPSQRKRVSGFSDVQGEKRVKMES